MFAAVSAISWVERRQLRSSFSIECNLVAHYGILTCNLVALLRILPCGDRKPRTQLVDCFRRDDISCLLTSNYKIQVPWRFSLLLDRYFPAESRRSWIDNQVLPGFSQSTLKSHNHALPFTFRIRNRIVMPSSPLPHRRTDDRNPEAVGNSKAPPFLAGLSREPRIRVLNARAKRGA